MHVCEKQEKLCASLLLYYVKTLFNIIIEHILHWMIYIFQAYDIYQKTPPMLVTKYTLLERKNSFTLSLVKS